MKKSLLSLLFFTLLSCTRDSTQTDTGIEQSSVSAAETEMAELTVSQNVIVVIDLSKRVVTNNQSKNDLATVNTILQHFSERQAESGYLVSTDRISIVIINGNSNNHQYSEDLSIDMSTDQMNKVKFDQKLSKLKEVIKKAYIQAAAMPPSKGDIWMFFRDQLNPYLKQDTEADRYFNKMIILSDGYLSFEKNIEEQRAKNTYMSQDDLDRLRNKSDWEKIFVKTNSRLQPHAEKDFNNLEVLMLEVKPIKPEIYNNEYQILQKYWKTWFSDMGIDFQIEQSLQNSDITKDVITKFLEKKNLYSSMALPLQLVGKNYKCEVLENDEIVEGFKGKYFIINLYQTDHRKLLSFYPGRYTIDIDQYKNSLAEFGSEIVNILHKSDFAGDFQIFVKGSADSLGQSTFRSSFETPFKFDRICYQKSLNDENYLFSQDIECENIEEPIVNKYLPNLRAEFIKQKFNNFYGGTIDEPKVLDGRVTMDISDHDRNATIFLYLPSKFFDN